jgi:hypothetical protein
VRSAIGSLLAFVKTKTGMATPLHGNIQANLDLKLKNIAVIGKERMNGIKLMALLEEFNICLLLLLIVVIDSNNRPNLAGYIVQNTSGYIRLHESIWEVGNVAS